MSTWRCPGEAQEIHSQAICPIAPQGASVFNAHLLEIRWCELVSNRALPCSFARSLPQKAATLK